MSERPERRRRDPGSSVGLVITLAAMAATALLVLTGGEALEALRHDAATVGVFLVLGLALQLFSVEVYGRGSMGVGSVGLLAAAFTLPVGAAVSIAFLVAVFQWIRKRGLLHRAIFDAANFTL